MAIFKTTSLVETNTPSSDTVIPCVQNGVTKQISVLQIKEYLNDGTVTSISSGDGVLCDPNPITTTGTVSFYAPGVMALYAGASDPAGWLICDGRSLSTSNALYQNLFNRIGYTYGGSGGSFQIPNVSDRFVFGVEAMQTSASGRVTSEYAGANPTLGNTGGYATVILSDNQSSTPSHNHTLSSTITMIGQVGVQGAGTITFDQNTVTEEPKGTFDEGAVTYSLTTSVNNASRFSAASAHDNQPPFLRLNYIIKL